MTSHHLAERLRTLRLQKGWNQDRVAASAGISRTTLHHLERGEIPRPRASTLYKLAGVLEVPVQQLSSAPVEWTVSTKGTSFDEAGGHSPPYDDEDAVRREFDRATNPAVAIVAAEEPALFHDWSTDDWDALYGTFATGGALTEEGVRVHAAKINRNRETVQRLHLLLETHLGTVAAEMIDALYRQVSLAPLKTVPPEEPRTQ